MKQTYNHTGLLSGQNTYCFVFAELRHVHFFEVLLICVMIKNVGTSVATQTSSWLSAIIKAKVGTLLLQ